VLQDAKINDSTQVINVGEEDNLNSTLKELVEDARVVQGFEDIAVSWRVPVRDGRLEGLRCGEEGVLQDSGVSGLVEGHDINVMTLVFLDDVLGVVVCVEGVHENERDVDIVCAVEVLNLSDRQIEERHAITDLDD